MSIPRGVCPVTRQMSILGAPSARHCLAFWLSHVVQTRGADAQLRAHPHIHVLLHW